MLKPLFATALIAGALVAHSGGAIAQPPVDVPPVFEATHGENPCNGLIDDRCVCASGLLCRGWCRNYVAGVCLGGWESCTVAVALVCVLP